MTCPKCGGVPNGLTLVSLFAGCGGSSLGYHMAGYDVRLAADWDRDACAAYRANFPDTPIWEGDIAGLSGVEALHLSSLGEGELDVLDGSPPCQGFSTAGKRRFLDRRNSLFKEYVRLLAAFKPKAFVVENVGGLARGKMRVTFAEMVLALKGAGYAVSCRLLNAWWYGVPQDRRRLVFVGVRAGLGVPPSHPPPTRRSPISVAEALGLAAATRRFRAVLRNAQFKNGWRPWALPSPTLESVHPPVLMERHPGYRDSSFSGGPAPTIGAGRKARMLFAKADLGKVESWSEPRYLTLDEAKTLQGFPPWFEPGAYRLVGNSVPPPMAEAVGRHVANLLEGANVG